MPFFDLGMVPLAGGFHKNLESATEEPVYPMKVVVCTSCFLVQGDTTVPECVMFEDGYFYFTSAIQTMVKHFAGLGKEVARRLRELQPSGEIIALEVGCNDGALLRPLQANGLRVIGVDPASNVTKKLQEEGFHVMNDYFNSTLASKLLSTVGPVQCIIGANCFAHIDDMHSILRGVKLLLSENGSFIFEVQRLLKLVENIEFDWFYHEHMSYYSVIALHSFFDSNDMRIYDVEDIPTHGGSMRVFVCHKSSAIPTSGRVAKAREGELTAGLGNLETYMKFFARVEKAKDTLLQVLLDLKSRGNSIVAYGASARSTTFCNFCGIGKQILNSFVDDNPAKIGHFTPGSHLPIKASKILLEEKPDYVLITAWTFLTEIARRSQSYLRNGGKFIIPLPEVKILEFSDFEHLFVSSDVNGLKKD